MKTFNEKTKNSKEINRLLEKSNEAFLLAIEIYNKPTIKYRVESFAFYICNAWELILKALIIKNNGINSIYYTNKNKEKRTIGIHSCINKIFPQGEQKENLLSIAKIRNLSTHYFYAVYDDTYVALFQSSINNYISFLHKHFNANITSSINCNFILFSNLQSNKKYQDINIDSNVSDVFKKFKQDIDFKKQKYNEIYSSKVIIKTVNINNKDSNAISYKDNSSIYIFRQKEVISEVNKRLKYENIKINFHQNILTEFNKYYNLKENNNFYSNINEFSNSWYCSEALINFIVNEIKNDPSNIINKIKSENKNKK